MVPEHIHPYTVGTVVDGSSFGTENCSKARLFKPIRTKIDLMPSYHSVARYEGTKAISSVEE